MKTIEWKLLGRPTKGGHRFFENIKRDGSRRIAIADESGVTPDRTDDGTLWLDMGVPMQVGTELVGIEVISDDISRGSVGRVHITLADAAWLLANEYWTGAVAMSPEAAALARSMKTIAFHAEK
jgi:hypothetical protein